MRVRALIDEGNKRAKVLNKVIENQGKMLSAILIGNNIVNITIEEIQTIEEKEKEFVFLYLRMLEGLNIEEFKNKFKKDPLDLFKNEINKLLNIKLIEISENNKYIRLTEKGLDLANIVWEEFI